MNKGNRIIMALIAICGVAGMAAIGVNGDRDKARPARLIGLCEGIFLTAMEESDFPAGCLWIEPIRVDTD